MRLDRLGTEKERSARLAVGTNVIHFEYQNVAFGCDPYGGDAVIGIENFAGDVGSQFAAWGWDPTVGQAYQPVLKAYERKKGLRFSP